MKTKIFFLVAVTMLLTSCWSEAVEAVGCALGMGTPEGVDSPATEGVKAFGSYLPYGLGAVLLGMTKLAHSVVRTKNAIHDSTGMAIEDGSLVDATTPEEVRDALSKAQARHHDSKRLEKHFDKKKNGGVLAKTIKKVGEIIT